MFVRLFGCFRLRSPLSHIGEAESTQTFLAQAPILQPDGSVEDVFRLSGNSWRGQLRDQMAAYMLDRLGSAGAPLRVPLETFHLLTSGGKIGGEVVTDVEAARRMRRAMPLLSLLGGGVGNQILAGKIRVSNCYPVCAEAIPVLPKAYHEEAARVSYGQLTAEEHFSRRDNSRDGSYEQYVAERDLLARALGDGSEPDAGKARRREGPAEQMRMTNELFIAGARLYSEIDCLDVTEVELGALVSAVHRWSLSPHLGGQANKGHGRADLRYELLDLETGEVREFLSVGDGPALLAPPAKAAKDAYDQHLRSLYDALLGAQGGEIRQLLGASA